MRTTFITTMEIRIKELDGKMDAMSARLKSADEKVRTDLEKRYVDYQTKRLDLVQRVEKAKTAPDNEFPEHKAGAEKLYEELAEYINNIYADIHDETGLY